MVGGPHLDDDERQDGGVLRGGDRRNVTLGLVFGEFLDILDDYKKRVTGLFSANKQFKTALKDTGKCWRVHFAVSTLNNLPSSGQMQYYCTLKGVSDSQGRILKQLS